MVKWRLIIEEFAAKQIWHIAGEDNAVADHPSRLEMEHQDFDLIETEVPKPILQYCNMLQNMEHLNIPKDSLKEIVNEAPFPQAATLFNKAQQEREVLKKWIAEGYK